MKTIECSRSGCPNEGKWRPRLLIPATGYALEEGSPATLVGHFRELAICDAHRDSDTVANYLTPEGRRRIVEGLWKSLGRPAMPPDFSRAELRYSGVG